MHVAQLVEHVPHSTTHPGCWWLGLATLALRRWEREGREFMGILGCSEFEVSLSQMETEVQSRGTLVLCHSGGSPQTLIPIPVRLAQLLLI